MRVLAVALLVAGCADEPFPVFPAGPLGVDSIDVVVTQRFIQVYTPYDDPGCVEDPTDFVDLGSCKQLTDTGCNTSCITSASLDGVVADPPLASQSWSWQYTPSSLPTTLELEGCGTHATIEIANRDIPIPSSLTFSRAGDVEQLDWTVDRPATSALVFLGTGFTGVVCHLPNTLHAEFSEWTGPVRSASVFTFAPVDEQPTNLGPAHVWYGGVSGIEPGELPAQTR